MSFKEHIKDMDEDVLSRLISKISYKYYPRTGISNVKVEVLYGRVGVVKALDEGEPVILLIPKTSIVLAKIIEKYDSYDDVEEIVVFAYDKWIRI